MRFRSWIVTTFVIGITLAVLSLLLVLQHNALYSELLRQRVAVIAQTTAETFRPILDLGLPISMLRDGDDIVSRGMAIDPNILAVHSVNPSGIILHSTGQKPATLPNEALLAMRLSDDDFWGHETKDVIYSGLSIRRAPDAPVSGAIIVEYPHEPLDMASENILGIAFRSAVLILIGTSALAFALIYMALDRPRRKFSELRMSLGAAGTAGTASEAEGHAWDDAIDMEISQLRRNLERADRSYSEAREWISTAKDYPTGVAAEPAPSDLDAPAAGYDRLQALVLGRLLPITIVLIVGSALLLGAVVNRAVTKSIEPELAARTDLIGTVVSENVQRALDSGIGLDEIVGADRYFGDMLTRLPEVAYIAIATGRIVIEAGERIDPYLAPPRERRGVRSHPIMHDGEEVAYVVIDIDQRLISKRFQNVLLDASVILLVTVLVAWEAMILLTSRSLGGGLERLQRLSAMQAAGDFSQHYFAKGRGSIQDMLRMLSDRARDLHHVFAAALAGAAENSRPGLQRIGLRFGLSAGGPRLQKASSFTDIRLALFMFAAADELPLAFLPIYTRAADNLWPWLDQSVLIALPLAGYLLAIVVMSPYARILVERFGVRGIFFGAAVPTFLAHVGLHFASTAQEIILWRTLTGFGYALVTLAAQDYVLSVTSKPDRDRVLGVFTLVLFGGIFSGVALGGVLADRLGPANVFLVSAALIAASAALCWWLISPEIGIEEKVTAHLRPTRRDKLRIATDLRLAPIIFGIAIPSAVVLQAFISYLVAITLNAEGATTAEIGRILMLYFLGIMAVGPLAGRLPDRLGISGKTLCLVGAAISGFSLFPVAFAPSQSTMALAMIGTGIGGALVRGTQVSIAMHLAETDLARLGASAVLGALRTGERLGSIVGLVLMAWLAGIAGYPTATVAIAVWTLAGGAFYATMQWARALTAMRKDL